MRKQMLRQRNDNSRAKEILEGSWSESHRPEYADAAAGRQSITCPTGALCRLISHMSLGFVVPELARRRLQHWQLDRRPFRLYDLGGQKSFRHIALSLCLRWLEHARAQRLKRCLSQCEVPSVLRFDTVSCPKLQAPSIQTIKISRPWECHREKRLGCSVAGAMPTIQGANFSVPSFGDREVEMLGATN